MATAADGEEVSVGEVLDSVGRRSFGPVLAVAGLVILAPILGDIPGVPTAMAVLVVLTVGQILFGRDQVWLPGFLLQRSVDHRRFCKALRWLRKPAGWIDRWTHARLTVLSRGQAARAVTGGLALLTAAATPPMELIPFSANGAGLTFTLLGVSLLTEDGALVVAAGVIVLGTIGLSVWQLS